jgi:hypothetical protein
MLRARCATPHYTTLNTLQVSATFSAIVALIPDQIRSIQTVTVKKELFVDDDALGKV